MKLKSLGYVTALVALLTGFAAQAQSEQEIMILDADGRVMVEELQEAINTSGGSWVAGDTPISRMTLEERKAILLDLEQMEIPFEGEIPYVPPPETRMYGPAADPSMAKLDWRDVEGEDWTSPVKQQGICGSCWAFGPIVVAEIAINILKDNPRLDFDLSEQYLVSCSPFGSCAWGGQPSIVFNYMQSTGIPDENCMPYVSGDTGIDGSCNNKCADWQQRAIKIQQWGEIRNSPENYQSMKEQIVNGGLGLTMTVYSDFSAYTGGVYKHTTGNSEGGHAIAIVGWDDSHDSWIIKNSWGVMWGEDGFAEMLRGDVSISRGSTQWLVMPNPPLLGVPCLEENQISIEAYQDSSPTEKMVEITNCGEEMLHWAFEPFYGTKTGWMSAEPTEGTLKVGRTTTISVFADPEGMAPQITRGAGFIIHGDHRDAEVGVSFSVQKAKAPTADFSAEPTEGDGSLTVQFASEITGTWDSVVWDFGDGDTSEAVNPKHEYTRPGIYTVSLTVDGSKGSDTETKEEFITVNGEGGEPPPVIDPDNVDASFDEGEGAAGDDSSGGCGCSTAGAESKTDSLLKGILLVVRNLI